MEGHEHRREEEASGNYAHGRAHSSRDGEGGSVDDTQTRGVDCTRGEEEHPDDCSSHHAQENSRPDGAAASGTYSDHFVELRSESVTCKGGYRSSECRDDGHLMCSERWNP